MSLLHEMAELIGRHALPDMEQSMLQASPVPGLGLYRSDAATATMVSAAYRPMLCLVVAGAKQTLLGDVLYNYQAGDCLVVSAELPVCGGVTAAPYRALSIDLDPAAVSRVMLEIGDVEAPVGVPPGIEVASMPEDLLDPVARLLRLLDRPHEVAIMTPMIERELIWRLLHGPHAATLRQIGSGESRLAGVSRAIRWLRAHFAEPMRVDDLAGMAGMSLSSFHRHFRTVTTMSPLQFQKQVRLQEARARLLAGGEGAAEAGFAVGYDSPSQFSREYARQFGAPPARDAARLRRELAAAG